MLNWCILDKDNKVRGWVYDDKNQDEIEIIISIDDCRFKVHPFISRKDVLKSLNIKSDKDLKLGFEFSIPEFYKDGAIHTIDIKESINNTSLKGFPVERKIGIDQSQTKNTNFLIFNLLQLDTEKAKIVSEFISQYNLELLLINCKNESILINKFKKAKNVIFFNNSYKVIRNYIPKNSKVIVFDSFFEDKVEDGLPLSNLNFEQKLLKLTENLKIKRIDNFEKKNIVNSETYNKDKELGFHYSRFFKNCFINLHTNEIKRISPNIVLIGSQKSGTTSLHNYMDQHPDVFMSKPLKEPGYFRKHSYSFIKVENVTIKNKYHLLEKFILKNYNDQKWIGESSTYYTLRNINDLENIALNIFESNPRTKLLYLIRNPFERLVSNYLHEFNRNYITESFNEWVIKRDLNILTSLYYKQISQYNKVFEKRNIIVMTYDELVENTLATMEKIEDFLGIERFDGYSFDVYNKTKSNKKVIQKDLLLNRQNWEKLHSLISDDIKKLEDFANLNLSHWNLSFEKWGV